MTKSTVLFLCTHNAGRSQMALGFFNRLAGDRAIAYSGGSEPADEIHPAAVAVMAEKGMDITGEHPKRWTDEMVEARRRRHDGLRRHVPVHSRPALRGLDVAGPGWAADRRCAACARRDRGSRPRAVEFAWRHGDFVAPKPYGISPCGRTEVWRRAGHWGTRAGN
jgi:Low molecular weight phosphotyrosine protein phosphatase